MNTFLKGVLIFIGSIICIAFITKVFNLLNIQFSSYGPYLLWIILIAIFYVVLPKNSSEIFQ
jgi:hypothetical protein